MNVSKFLRKKVASSVNNVELPDQFEWGKWLREASVESEEIGNIISSIYPDKFDISFPKSSSEVYKFNTQKVKLYKGSKKFFSLPKEKTIKVFFRLTHPYTNKLTLFETGVSKISFTHSFQKQTEEQTKIINKTRSFREGGVSSKDISFKLAEPETKELNIYSKPSATREIIINFSETGIKEFIYELTREEKPETVFEIADIQDEWKVIVSSDLLLNLEKGTKIVKLDVFNLDKLIEELSKDSKKINNIPIKYLTDRPKIRKVKTLSVNSIKVPTYFLKNAQIKNIVGTFSHFSAIDQAEVFECALQLIPKLKAKEEKIKVEDILLQNPVKDKEDPSDVPVKDELPVEIIPDNLGISKFYLYDYQLKGAEFLVNHKVSLLCDEMGLGKTYQVITALDALFKNNKITKALIVTSIADTGIDRFQDGWTGKLNVISPELTFSVQNGDELTTGDEKNIIFINYNSLFKYFSSEKSLGVLFHEFDCIVFDEIQNIFSNKLPLKKVYENAGFKYLWMLSSLPVNDIKKELNIGKNSSIIELRREKSETAEELPNMFRQDVWHELDDEQKTEYENTLSLGRERISKLLQMGNPFIVQSNVFTLLHQLKQVCNFSSTKNSSSKSDYLLKQLESIIKNQKKVLIFSQYDKMGTKKLEHIFNSNKLRYILLHSGMSMNELETAIRRFKTDKNISILINGIKASRTLIKLPEVPYIIHFDQWWNPASVWKMEENINISSDNNSNVYNYFTKNTVEEKIKETLYKKGLHRKEIIEYLSAESINEMISPEEWLDILELNDKKSEINDLLNHKLQNLSLFELGKKTENFFARLGYKNLISNKGNFEGEMNIIGTLMENNNKIKMVAKCLFTEKVDLENITEYIENLQHTRNSNKNFIIHFNGLDDKLPFTLKKKIILINKDLFASYLFNFRLL